jgi:quinohemoprotein ethanol dehydrogenase
MNVFRGYVGRTLLITAVCLTAALLAGYAADRPKFGNINRERLLRADKEPGQWLTSDRDFGHTHHSALTDINKQNAKRLGFAWDYKTGTTRGMEATPIVVDGVLYTSGPTGRVYALHANTGKELWKFDPQSDGQVNRWACCDEVNRGVAVWDGMVYVASLDGRMFGLDAGTGKVIWKVDTVIDHKRGYTSTGSPEVAGNVVVIGNGGADYDARGYVSAYDIKTGAFKWRFFMVPRDPALGPQEHEELTKVALPTWDPKSRWDVGGGGTPWGPMVYDPELNLLYLGSGNSSLFNWHERSPSGGDNLFLCSLLAIRPDTGKLAWYYQQVPRESWDFTATQQIILTDLAVDGQKHKVLMQAPKNGFFYVLDRETGKVLRAEKYVPVNWASRVDLKTGKPEINNDVADYTFGGPPKWVVPSGMGGHSWNSMTWDAKRHLAFIPAIEGGSVTFDATNGHQYKPLQANSGNSILFGDSLLANPDSVRGPMGDKLREVQKSGEHVSYSVLKAFDPLTGKVKWERRNTDWWDRPGILSTDGGVLFQGTDRGLFRVIDSDTGDVLKEIEVGSSIIDSPMTYKVDGVQYVAVMAGWGGGGWFAPHPTSAVIKYGNAGRIIAFRLDGGKTPLPPEINRNPTIPQPPAQFADAQTITRGSRLFGSCRTCHANQPDGMTPDLRRVASLGSAKTFKSIVLEGILRPRGMPQWDDVLSEADTEAIRAYLVDLAQSAYKAQQSGVKEKQDVVPTDVAH